MLACMGILLITGACALFVKYQPRILENQMLCGMMAVMGLVALLAGQGNGLFTAVQVGLGVAMAVCCTLRVRREYACRLRRQRRMRALHRAPVGAGPLKRASGPVDRAFGRAYTGWQIMRTQRSGRKGCGVCWITYMRPCGLPPPCCCSSGLGR